MTNAKKNTQIIRMSYCESYLYGLYCYFQSRIEITDTGHAKHVVPRTGQGKPSWQFARTANNAVGIDTSQVNTI